MKKDNIRFTAKVLSLALATGITLTTPSSVYAEKGPKPGSFIEHTIENEDVKYNRYVAKEGDNLSRISEKICRFFGEEKTTKYWPVIAFLNGYPKTLNPNEVIIFPATFEEMVLMYNNLKEIGWTSRYIQKNDIYGNAKRKQFRKSMRELLRDIYGKSVKINDEFIETYLNTIGLQDKYDAYSGDFDNDELFELTEWIPTLDELQETKKYTK